MEEGLVRHLLAQVDPPDRVYVKRAMAHARGEDTGVEGACDAPVADEDRDRIRRDVCDHDVGAVLEDGEVRDPELLGAGLVGVGLEPRVRGRAPMEPGDHDRGDAAPGHHVIDACAPADVLSRALPAHHAPVRNALDGGDGADPVPHRVAERAPLDRRPACSSWPSSKAQASGLESLKAPDSVAKRMAVVPWSIPRYIAVPRIGAAPYNDTMYSVVTGGAGFIGSHLVDALVARGDEVLVIDNLSTGERENLGAHSGRGRVELLVADLLKDGWQQRLAGADRIYHVAADPDVRGGASSPVSMFEESVVATVRVLEAMRETGVPEIAFTSTSTVYGEASVIPTPEDYAPMVPISVYGAGKLACEAMIGAYCHSYGMRSFVFRFANIVGERSNHGVSWDFIRKLRVDPHVLEILGDGRQTKSYLEVHACVDAFLYVCNHATETVNTVNIGSEDWVDVVAIADLVTDAMGLADVEYRFTGGDRGWVGDVPRMRLSIDRLEALGWRPPLGSRESMEAAIRAQLGAA